MSIAGLMAAVVVLGVRLGEVVHELDRVATTAPGARPEATPARDLPLDVAASPVTHTGWRTSITDGLIGYTRTVRVEAPDSSLTLDETETQCHGGRAHVFDVRLDSVSGGWGIPYAVNPGDPPHQDFSVNRGFVITEVWGDSTGR